MSLIVRPDPRYQTSYLEAHDEFGGVHNPSGLDVTRLFEHVAATGSVVGFDDADPIDNARLLALDVDVLVPAAVDGVLNAETAPTVKF